MSRTLDLFPELKPPRRPPRVLMRVVDAHEAEGFPLCRLQCRRCGHETQWIEFESVTEAKRGLPCPRCNPASVITAAEQALFNEATV